MGKYTQMSMFGERKISIDMDKLVVKEINMVGSQSQRWTSWDKLIKLLSDREAPAGTSRHPRV